MLSCFISLRQSYVISEGYLFDVSVSCLHVCKYVYVDTASLLVLFLLLCLRFVTVLLLSCLLACLFVCLFVLRYMHCTHTTAHSNDTVKHTHCLAQGSSRA